MTRVGVVALQGDFEKHLIALAKCGDCSGAIEVRTPEDLVSVDRLIIPGGESTTVGKLMERYGLGQAIVNRAGQGMPIWGTCMGAILLASEVEGMDQYRLKLLDVTVKRNAFGAQVNSFETEIEFDPLKTNIEAVFIRAPIFVEFGAKVHVLSKLEEKIVAVRQDSLVATSFHPELTEDTRVHEWFLKL